MAKNLMTSYATLKYKKSTLLDATMALFRGFPEVHFKLHDTGVIPHWGDMQHYIGGIPHWGDMQHYGCYRFGLHLMWILVTSEPQPGVIYEHEVYLTQVNGDHSYSVIKEGSRLTRLQSKDWTTEENRGHFLREMVEFLT